MSGGNGEQEWHERPPLEKKTSCPPLISQGGWKFLINLNDLLRHNANTNEAFRGE